MDISLFSMTDHLTVHRGGGEGGTGFYIKDGTEFLVRDDLN